MYCRVIKNYRYILCLIRLPSSLPPASYTMYSVHSVRCVKCTHTDLCHCSWRALNLTQKHLKRSHDQQLGPCCFVSKPKTKSWKGCNVLSNILAEGCRELDPSLLCHGPEHFVHHGLIFLLEVCLESQSCNITDLISHIAVAFCQKAIL